MGLAYRQAVAGLQMGVRVLVTSAVLIGTLTASVGQPAWAGGFGCCQCECSEGDPPRCTNDAGASGCPVFCIGGGCTEGSFIPGALCGDVPACGIAPDATAAAVPALGAPGLIIAGLALATLGVRTARRRQAR